MLTLDTAELLKSLEIFSIRTLEDLLIEAIYSDLIVGKINQKKQVLEVDSVVGRDVRFSAPSQGGQVDPAKTIDGMMFALSAWYSKVGETLENLDVHIQDVRNKECVAFKTQRLAAC